MEEKDRDVEVFERLPWESLSSPGDKRWWVYLAAAAVVMGAIGVSVGRTWSSAPASSPATTITDPASPATSTPPPPPPATSPPPPATSPPPPATSTPPPPATSTPPPPATTSTVWSEADLMAVPAERLERQAEVLAMWFVTDHFTRDDGDGRSFVEWSGVVDLVWRSSATVDVTVRTRRLAAVDGEPYARLPEEAWRVGLEIGDQGWTVASGPVAVDDAHLVAVEAAPGSEWTDAAGLTWMVDESDRP